MLTSLICLLLFVSPNISFGESLGNELSSANGFVQLEGMSIYCPECARVDEQFCEIRQGAEQLLVDCENIVDYLLPPLAVGDYDGKHPAPKELMQYLLREERDYTRSRAALRLLGKSSKGKQLLAQNASVILRYYRSEIEELVNLEFADSTVWSAFWNTAQDAGSAIRLRSIILVRHPDIGLEEFFSQMSVTDSEADLELLNKAGELLRVLGGSEFEFPIRNTARSLKACSDISSKGDSCLAAITSSSSISLEPLPDSAKRYLGRVRMQSALSNLQQERVSAREKIALLTKSGYQLSRTDSAHGVVREAVRELLAEDTREGVFSKSELTMLAVFAEQDEQLRRDIGLLAAKGDLVGEVTENPAREEFKRGRLGKVLSKSGVSNDAEGSKPGVFILVSLLLVSLLLIASSLLFRWRNLSFAGSSFLKREKQYSEEPESKSQAASIAALAISAALAELSYSACIAPRA